jgi:predicted metalloendopeptidase
VCVCVKNRQKCLQVSHSTWMDDETRLAAVSKIQKLRVNVAYPKWIFEDRLLNEYYEGLL